MSVSCFRCRKTDNNPQSFLLACSKCQKTWHHTCHIPPVSQEELHNRMRATLDDLSFDNLSDWVCRRCARGPKAVPVNEATLHDARAEERDAPMSPATPLVIDPSSRDMPTQAAGPSHTTEVDPHQEPSSATFAPYVSPLVGLVRQPAAALVPEPPSVAAPAPTPNPPPPSPPPQADDANTESLCLQTIRERHRAEWAALPRTTTRTRRETARPQGVSFCFTIENWVRAHRSGAHP